jgi:hypothetical protein
MFLEAKPLYFSQLPFVNQYDISKSCYVEKQVYLGSSPRGFWLNGVVAI